MNRTVLTLLATLAIVLAGWTGAMGAIGTDAAGAIDGATAAGSDAATVDFYVSDEKNDIDDFEHLNVTITGIAFKRADGTWVRPDVTAQTVDLTRLHGENATLVDSRQLPEGTYVETVLTVGGVNGTLKGGESATVKLPSGRLRLTEQFTVTGGESVDFVFDITVVEAGRSGKYVLTPVVSESGTDQPVDPVDGEGAAGGDVDVTFSGGTDPGETLVVRVTEGGAPVRGVEVQVSGEERHTGPNGTVTVEVPADAEKLKVKVEYGGETAELSREFGDADTDGNSGGGPPPHAEAEGHEKDAKDEDEEDEHEGKDE